MAVVRIEVDFDVDLDDGVTSAGSARVELDSPDGDLPQILERAQGAMLRLLPQETREAPVESQTILTLNNVRFTQVDQETLFGRAVAPPPTRVDPVRVQVKNPPTQQKGQCSDRCPRDEAGHPPCRCELPLGHGSKHRAHSTGHGWPNPRGEDLGGVLPAECGEMLQFGDCPKPKGHDGKCVDNGRCASCCPESHRPPQQCALAQGHRGSHEAGDCLWSGQELHQADEVESREMCADRVYWLGKAYNCNRPEGHPDHHENADQGFRWEIDGSLQICSGEWGHEVTSPLSGSLACRLPEGHEGDCGPLPDADRGGPEAVDCA